MTTPRHRDHARRHVRRWSTLAAVVALAVLAGCGDDDADSSPNDGAGSGADSTTTTQPPASNEEEAFPIIEDMVLEATSLVDELFQDPTAADDPDNPEIARLREIYTDDSTTPDQVIDQLRELAANGQRERPAASGVFRDLGVYQMSAIDADTVRFRVCASEDIETVDENETVVDQTAQVVQGVGEARRVNGIWRFYGIHPENDRTLPIEPGSANPGYCDALFADSEEPT